MKKIKITKASKVIPENVVFKGDNLEIIKSGIIPSESLDLVYIDPPFCTQRKQSAKSWSKKIRFGSYDDKWGGGIASYQIWLRNRIQAIYNLLKEDGSLFLHLDYNASHYGKIVCDEVFGQGDKDIGRKLLMNEIIWCYRETAGGRNGNYYKKAHQTILWYCKDKKRKTNVEREKTLSKETLKRYGKHFDKNGIITYRDLKEREHGVFNRFEKVNRVPSLDSVFLDKSKGGNKTDWWHDINPVTNKGNPEGQKEPFIYPTQKPIKLLKRIIETATKEGDTVADFFCGCGVALTTADMLNRKWIGVDKSQDSITALRKHLAFHRQLIPEIIETIDLKKSDISKMEWDDYQDWAVRRLGGKPAKIKNKGADGFMPDGSWVEVKKWTNKAGLSSYRQVLEGLHKTGQAYIISRSGFSNDLKEKKNQILLSKGWELHLIPEDDLVRDLVS